MSFAIGSIEIYKRNPKWRNVSSRNLRPSKKLRNLRKTSTFEKLRPSKNFDLRKTLTFEKLRPINQLFLQEIIVSFLIANFEFEEIKFDRLLWLTFYYLKLWPNWLLFIHFGKNVLRKEKIHLPKLWPEKVEINRL